MAAPRSAVLLQHQREHRGCTRCVDADLLPRAHPVFSGRPGQRMMLVGQAPGPVEDDVTRPFAGRAGRELMRWMVRAGFRDEADVRDRVWMTSMITCFPGRLPGARGDRRPSAAQVRLHASWLDGELTLLAPRLVIAVGGLAHSRFCPRGRGLEDVIGRAFTRDGTEAPSSRVALLRVGLGLPLVLPLPHPSGQSRWLNDPGHTSLLESALTRLRTLVAWAEVRA